MISAEGDYTTNYGITGGREDHRRNAVDSPRPISALDSVAREQQLLISAFAGNVQMLRELADKLLGPVPPSPQTKPGGDGNKRVGAIGMLADQAETLVQIQTALTHVCDRLAGIA